MRFVGYLAGSKGWKFWQPDTNTFVKSAHAKWLSGDFDNVGVEENPPTSVPIPDPPSTIHKLLNVVGCEEDSLMEALRVSYDLNNLSITRDIRDQDKLVAKIWAMASGISAKLPRSYNAAMKSEESELWKAACKKEMKMLVSMKVWEEVVLPPGKQAVLSKWVVN